MLVITVPAVEETELWDERIQEFVYAPPQKEQVLQLEHSLVSVSKWESKWHKPFFSKDDKSQDETLDYIRCMTINKNIDDSVYMRVITNQECINKILEYINDPMTATIFSNLNSKKGSRDILTSEVIYYMMFVNGIPIECERWHIARLITLIRVFGEKNAPQKKMSRAETTRQYAALNAARRKKIKSKG